MIAFRILRRVVWYKLTDVSEVLAAIALITMAVSSSKTSVDFYHATHTTTRKTAIFTLVAVRT
jgi:hypothetical protein